MTYLIAALLTILIVLVAVQLLRGTPAPEARLKEGETERIAGLVQSQIVRIQGDIQRSGSEQLAAHNVALLQQETARGEEQLKARQGEIDRGLGEVRQELGRLRDLVREVDARRGESLVRLAEVTRESKQQTELLRSETQRLNEVLSGANTRGQWGERMAEDVLRLAGFVEGIQYTRQRQVEGGSARPDFSFDVNGQRLNMDVKTPMGAYQRYLASDSDQQRQEAARSFRRDVRNRVKEATSREYIDPEGGTLDYVLVFIPNEQVYAFLHENDPDLLDAALAEKAVLCSPLTLFAILAVIRQASASFQFAEQANEVLRALGGFTKQWTMFRDQMAKVEQRLDSARRAYTDLVTTRTRQLDKQVERVQELSEARGLQTGEAGSESEPEAEPQTEKLIGAAEQ